MSFRVQIRRDPSGKWLVNNPILLSGEFGYETDTTFLKIGDGATAWNYLPYWEGGQGPVGPTGSIGVTGPTGSVFPYKVYTALLTQSGGSGQAVISFPIPLTIGRTYQIINHDAGADFTNVGAPNNDLGTYFVATGENPAQWGEGELEFETGAPEVKVLENTIGNIWFTYYSPGIYNIYSNGLFTANKTFMELSNVTDINNNSSGSIFVGFGLIESDSNLKIQSDAFTDGDMYNTPIEIRVYN